MDTTATDFYARLNWVDVTVCLVLLFSLVVGLVRGFFAQVAGLFGVLGALFLAFRFAPVVSDGLQTLSSELGPSTMDLLAFTGLFLGSLVVWLLITHFLRKLIVRLDFGTYDRFLGGAFGVLKGALVAYVFLILIHRFLPDTWSVNQHLARSTANQGIELVDRVLKAQHAKERIPSVAWAIIANLREFDTASPATDTDRVAPPSTPLADPGF